MEAQSKLKECFLIKTAGLCFEYLNCGDYISSQQPLTTNLLLFQIAEASHEIVSPLKTQLKTEKYCSAAKNGCRQVAKTFWYNHRAQYAGAD